MQGQARIKPANATPVQTTKETGALDDVGTGLLNAADVIAIVITDKGGAQRKLSFPAAEISIGRLEDNDIVLPKSNVSKYHARIVHKDDRFVVLDMKSTNGTYVNGRRIAAPIAVRKGDKIYIGDFIITLAAPSGVMPAVIPDVPSPNEAKRSTADRDPQRPPAHDEGHDGHDGPATSHHEFEDGEDALEELDEEPGDAQNEPPRDQTVIAKMPLPASMNRDTRPPSAGESMPPPAALPPPPRMPRPADPVPAGQVTVHAEPPSMSERPGLSMPPVAPAPAGAAQVANAALITPRKSMPPRVEDHDSAQGPKTSPAVLAPSLRLQGALCTLMERLAEHMDVHEPKERAFPSDVMAKLDGMLAQLSAEGALSADIDRRYLTDAAISEAVGLGPLDRLLASRSVREIVVDGPARVLADVGGGLSAVSAFFSTAEAVTVVAQRLLARAGHSLDATNPVHEVQLPDGTLVTLLLPPLSPRGPLISVRKPARNTIAPEGLVTEGTLSADMLSLLRKAVHARRNILVCGPNGVGVSSLVCAVAGLAQDHERLLVLDHTLGASIAHPQVLTLNRAAVPQMELNALIKHAARMHFDRLIIDDLKPSDALPLLMTAASQRGLVLGMHAPTATAALEQLALFAQLGLGGQMGGGSGGPRNMLAELIAQAISVVVHIGQLPDGSRRVLGISELRGARDETLEARPLYRYDNGFRATEHRASFLE